MVLLAGLAGMVLAIVLAQVTLPYAVMTPGPISNTLGEDGDGTPLIAVDSEVHREVIFDGGELVAGADAATSVDGLADALRRALASTAAAERLAVLAGDRGRSFSWREAADKVWHLHAEL